MGKAVDSLEHNLLPVKLQDVSASPLALQWFRSYLTSSCQVVTIGKAVSERLQVVRGVPQGSILGPLLLLGPNVCDSDHRHNIKCGMILRPLLFSIYMNDLP